MAWLLPWWTRQWKYKVPPSSAKPSLYVTGIRTLSIISHTVLQKNKSRAILSFNHNIRLLFPAPKNNQRMPNTFHWKVKPLWKNSLVFKNLPFKMYSNLELELWIILLSKYGLYTPYFVYTKVMTRYNQTVANR